MSEDDEDEEREHEDDEETVYPEVDVTLKFSDDDDEPVPGLRVALKGEFGFWGEEQVTDGSGEVEFTVRAWRTYGVWVEHEEFDEIGVGGEGETFRFGWDAGDD